MSYIVPKCFELKLPKNLKNLTKEFTIAAAYSGELGLLKDLRQQNPPCPWDEMMCAAASMNGNLNILQWAREQNPPCPWDVNTFIYAVMNGHLDILKWISTQNPNWNDLPISFLSKIAHQNVLKWLCEQYYQRDGNIYS